MIRFIGYLDPWRGSLLPLGCEAAPSSWFEKTGPATQSNGSKLPRHEVLAGFRVSCRSASRPAHPPVSRASWGRATDGCL
ncbi:hypothetical protein F7R03_04945 [Pseudomonas palleroniana]|uniref:Uncharacterized protein n=1 Tax=Pseudomonas palleroniana TaxID=191390 RepID=A0A6H9SGL8_9PSED|nr:hypothetical protein F7R03_04945 [Pseudomonas palleroniana]